MKENRELSRNIAIIGVLLLMLNLLTLWRVEASNTILTIAGVDIETTEREEIADIIRLKIENWRNTPLQVETDYGVIELDTNLFSFESDYAVSEYMKESKKPWYKFWADQKNVEITLPVTIDDQVANEMKKDPSIKIEETIELLEREISEHLSSAVVAVQFDKELIESDRIAFTSHNVPEIDRSVHELVEQLNDLTIMPAERISFLSLIGDGKYDSSSLDWLASSIYTILLQSNYSILERHPGDVPLSSFAPGTEAHVNKKQAKDLVFSNPNVVMGTFKFKIEEDQLVAELYSIPLEVKTDFFQEKQEVAPRTITRFSEKLGTGEVREMENGTPGLIVTTYRKVVALDGPYEKDEFISKDFYPPLHRVVLKALPAVSQGVSEGDNSSSDSSSKDTSSDQGQFGQGKPNDDGSMDLSDDQDANDSAQSELNNSNNYGNSDKNGDDHGSTTVVYDKSGMPINTERK